MLRHKRKWTEIMDGAVKNATSRICDRSKDRPLATESFEISGFLYHSLEHKDVVDLLYERQNSLRRCMADRRRQTN